MILSFALLPNPETSTTQCGPSYSTSVYSFLSRSMPDRNELIACLRLLLLLTKSHHMATEFVTWGGLPLLLDRFRGAGDDVRGCQVHVIHIPDTSKIEPY